MYAIESMIELGLKPKQKWPTRAHRAVACNLAICNPMIRSRDQLIDLVQKVVAIPRGEIKTVMFSELPKYGIVLVATG